MACDGVDVERRGDGQERGFQLALQLELDRPHLVLRRRREDGAEIVQRAEYWAVDGVAEAEEVVQYLRVLRHGYYGMRLRCPARRPNVWQLGGGEHVAEDRRGFGKDDSV